MAEEGGTNRSSKNGENWPETRDCQLEENSDSTPSEDPAEDVRHSPETRARRVTSPAMLTSNRLTPVAFVTKVIGWMRETHGSTVAGMRRYVTANFDVNSESLLTAMLWKGVALGMACGALTSPARHRGCFKLVTEESRWRTSGRSVWTQVDDNANTHCVSCEHGESSSESETSSWVTCPSCSVPVDYVPRDTDDTGHECEEFSNDLNGNCFYKAWAASNEGVGFSDNSLGSCSQGRHGKLSDGDSMDHIAECTLIRDKCSEEHHDSSTSAHDVKEQTTDGAHEEDDKHHPNRSAESAVRQRTVRRLRPARDWGQQRQPWRTSSSDNDCGQYRQDGRRDDHLWSGAHAEDDSEDFDTDARHHRPSLLPPNPDNPRQRRHSHAPAPGLPRPLTHRLPDPPTLSTQRSTRAGHGIRRPALRAAPVDTVHSDQGNSQQAATPPALRARRGQGSRSIRSLRGGHTPRGQRSTRANSRLHRSSEGGGSHHTGRAGNATPRQRGRRGRRRVNSRQHSDGNGEVAGSFPA